MSSTLSLAAAASAPLRTMSQKVSPGAGGVIMAFFRRGVVAAGGAAPPAAAGAWVGCDGAPPALQAMATMARVPVHAKNNVRLADSPSRGLLILRVSLSRAGSQVSGCWSACQYILSSFRAQGMTNPPRVGAHDRRRQPCAVCSRMLPSEHLASPQPA